MNKLADYTDGQGVVQVDNARWIQYVLDTVAQMRSRMPPTAENCDGGLYVGCAGVAYACFHLGRSEPLAGSRDRLLAMAVEYIDVALSYAVGRRGGRDPPAAFLLGPAGVLATASLIYDLVGRSEDAAAMRQRYAGLAATVSQRGDFLGFGSDELFVGRAGYLCGALALNAAYKQQVKFCRIFWTFVTKILANSSLNVTCLHS